MDAIIDLAEVNLNTDMVTNVLGEAAEVMSARLDQGLEITNETLVGTVAIQNAAGEIKLDHGEGGDVSENKCGTEFQCGAQAKLGAAILSENFSDNKRLSTGSEKVGETGNLAVKGEGGAIGVMIVQIGPAEDGKTVRVEHDYENGVESERFSVDGAEMRDNLRGDSVVFDADDRMVAQLTAQVDEAQDCDEVYFVAGHQEQGGEEGPQRDGEHLVGEVGGSRPAREPDMVAEARGVAESKYGRSNMSKWFGGG